MEHLWNTYGTLMEQTWSNSEADGGGASCNQIVEQIEGKWDHKPRPQDGTTLQALFVDVVLPDIPNDL